ncbi:MAG: NFACT family protein [Oscillospiraceae bacterium]|jgi:predicted ribosome quality control (RQC) complex YloA/Tae2 family protein|nr:NFACT family protein [Oscillospiraceae bacterium]
MPLDALFLSAALRELEPELIGARVEKIRMPERDEIILVLRGKSKRNLLISAGAADARAHFTNSEYENPAAPPMFCMLLRKHLSGARIASVTQPRGERVVLFKFSCLDAMGEPEEKTLAAELMGRGANMILTASDGIIIDALRRIDAEISPIRAYSPVAVPATKPRRPVLPGLLYRPPAPQEKIDPIGLSQEDWKRAFADAPGEASIEKWLNKTFSALSPLICRELAFRAYGSADATTAAAGDGGAALAERAAELIEGSQNGAAAPYILIGEDGVPRDFSFTEIRQYGKLMTVSREDGFSALLERFFTERAASARAKTRGAALTRAVKNARDRAQRRVSAQREELLGAGKREYLRECGDLIMANLHLIKPGDEILRAEDLFIDNTGSARSPSVGDLGSNAFREIKLDPRRAPQANAAKYYKDYAKLKTAEKILSERIELGERETEYLESVLSELALASGERELEEIRRELAQTGYVKPEKAKSKQKQKPYAPRRYTAPSGREILIGRSNTQNDELTFRAAFKTDVWLHVKARHGSHVILRTGGAPPEDADVAAAASLAAYFSEARGEGRAAVDWCLARYVKKTPGAKPGMVIYTDYKTVAAAPQPPEAL